VCAIKVIKQINSPSRASRPWESISKNFLGGMTQTYDYIFVIVYHFNKITNFIPDKKTITSKEATQFFFEYVSDALWTS
jgi:hypothetical protein